MRRQSSQPSLLGVTEELFEKTMGVNLKGPLRLTAFQPSFLAQIGDFEFAAASVLNH